MQPPSPPTLAVRLERLFAEARKPDGSRCTQAEAVAGTGGALTRVYLWKLRTGRATNPSFHVLQALADYFGVPVSYFAEEEAAGLPAPHTGRYLPAIMERAARLDEAGQKAVLALMDYLLSRE